MPRQTPQETGPQNTVHCGETAGHGFGAVLGPRAEEIAAAAESLGGITDSSLERLAAEHRFGVTRPRRHPDKFGAEHDVFLAPGGLRVIKHARNHGFGPVVENRMLLMRPCSPLGYLKRHALMEQVFPTDVKVEGLTDDGHFVISQRAIMGNHPTEPAIRKYFLKLGFENVPARFGQGGDAWFHRGLGILVMDTAPDNFISAKQGLVPIDLQIAELTGLLLGLADAVESMQKNAPKAGL